MALACNIYLYIIVLQQSYEGVVHGYSIWGVEGCGGRGRVGLSDFSLPAFVSSVGVLRFRCAFYGIVWGECWGKIGLYDDLSQHWLLLWESLPSHSLLFTSTLGDPLGVWAVGTARIHKIDIHTSLISESIG